ncbi:flagellar hook-associated protein FlgK [Corticimicrobacter populi]|uniref:Flagellar hook-associated protein 1 n=1 Tax=Corticimicrobacter populi TaxID=2175229 RepID=A0A2V1JWM8_9BURK|nr:flagellar hook-associated protein FlgK [Corticimicrobacter populi]PWF21188.1 flagellar hook-associated protein FlgK [Corticimicrobacter populi]
MNLYNLGVAGINAARIKLDTTGHNLNNVDTVGFNRQKALTSTAGATLSGNGFIGRGVQIDGVVRQYDDFRFRQLVSARSTESFYGAYAGQIGQLNDLLADKTAGVNPALTKFFDSVDALASQPGMPATRQEMLGQAQSLVTQLNEANRFLSNQRDDLNTQIQTTVEQINSYVERINDLNKQIVSAKATARDGQHPNDLYDQRDQLVSELNQLVDVQFTEEGSYFSLSIGNGQTLLSGEQVFPLSAVRSSGDPSRLVIAYSSPNTGGGFSQVEIKENLIKGGQLGGLLAFRRDTLDTVQNDLGRLATGLALAFNEQHEQGLDAFGQPGGAFFNVANPTALANSRNATTTGSLGVQFAASGTTPAYQALTGHDYELKYDGTDYTLTNLTTGQTYTPVTDNMVVDGVQYTLPATASAGDSWQIQPVRQGARDLGLAITEPDKIAAADSSGGATNGENGLLLAKLRTERILGNGSLNPNDAFSRLINKVGVKTQEVTTASKSQQNLVTQRLQAQQDVSGVNQDEELMSLMQFSDQYRAAARLIDVGSQLFDTLLGLRN